MELSRPCAVVLPMETLRQDFRFALRMMFAKPAFTIVAILALALGIGANTAIFTVIDSILLKPLPYRDAARLVTLSRGYPNGFSASVSDTKFLYWKEHNRAFEDVAGYDVIVSGCNLTGSGEPERIPCIRVSEAFFRVLGKEPVLGRNFRPQEDKPGGERVAIISDGLWRRRFGADPGIVGRSFNISGEPTNIIGVAPPDFRWSSKADMFTAVKAQSSPTDRGNIIGLIAKLKPDVSITAARADATAMYASFLATILSSKTVIGVSASSKPARRYRWRCAACALGIGRRSRLRTFDRLCERRKPAAGARRRASEGDCDTYGDGRGPLPPHPPDAH